MTKSKVRIKERGDFRLRPLKRASVLFFLPTLAAFAIGFAVPFVRGIYLSFCSFTTIGNAKFTGLDNYRKVFADSGFIHSFWYTALFAAVSIVAINVLSFAVAYALTRNLRGANIFRTVFFMPNLIGGIVLGYIWQLIFNGILARYGQTILSNEKYGFVGLVVMMCWQQIGYMMIIYIAGLQGVPEQLTEAARIDGANSWQVLTKITLPSIMPSITICTFLTLTNSFKLFDQNLALTAGYPARISAGGSSVKLTEMLALNIYNTFYNTPNSRGVGQAKAVLFFVLVVAISFAQLALTKRREVDG